MAREWKARFAPTVLFLDAQGREIAERLVGVTLIEFYDQYLWQRIGQAQTKLAR
jgi:hypothetical protein